MFFTARGKIAKAADALERIFGEKSGREKRGKSRDEFFRFDSAVKKVNSKIAQLEKEKSHVQAILDSMIEGVIALDGGARIAAVNPAAAKIFQIADNQAIGRFFLEVIPNNAIYEIITEVLGNGEFLSRELDLVWPARRIFQVNASPIFEGDEVSGCLLVIHDITEMRRLEAIRSDFVANVSHELKTPLTSIKGFVETLLDGAWKDKENAPRFLEIIHGHTERLNNLINDLLELSFLESGEMKLDKNEFDFKELADKTLLNFKARLNEKNISAGNKIPPGTKVNADSGKLEQALANLIDNAIKFSPEKSSINVYSESLDNRLKVIVEDFGPGIPAKHLPRLFERFYRVDKARSSELGGTGLGLSIVKHLIELHKGTVGVESVEGLGSKFWFIIPK
ncbi:MAG: ATP-binding protein [Candidatus Omnitrophota bacterium]